MNTLEIWPVIHVDEENPQITFRNAELAALNGCNGVFLISMNNYDEPLCRMARTVKAEFPELKVGVNHLQKDAPMSLRDNLMAGLDATWTDHSEVSSAGAETGAHDVSNLLKSNPGHLFFGAVAFKYQAKEPNPAQAALLAHKLGMIPTTSGPRTGTAASLEKLRGMREQIGEIPLAIASGITPQNLAEQAPFLTHVLVSTGISLDEYTFCPEKLKDLMREADSIRQTHENSAS